MKKPLAVLGAAAILTVAGSTHAEAHRSEVSVNADAAETAAAPAKAAVGQAAPDFVLTDTEGKEYRLSDYSDGVVVLEWFNPDCPFVKKHHQKNKTMQTTYAQWQEEEIVWLAINSGAPGKQGAGLERNRKAKTDYGIEYPVLLDEAGTVGRIYGAKTTPHMFVIEKGILIYAGAIDDNASPSTLGKTNHVSAALSCCADGRAVEKAETKAYGCTVKYGAASL